MASATELDLDLSSLARSLSIAAKECTVAADKISSSSSSSTGSSSSSSSSSLLMKGECVRLSRKLSLLAYLFEEINASIAPHDGELETQQTASSAVDPIDWLRRLVMGLEAVNRFLTMVSRNFVVADTDKDVVEKRLSIQLQYVTWQLEKVLENIPNDHFTISDEVQEQVELVRAQLQRMVDQSNCPNLSIYSEIYPLLSTGPLKDSESGTLARSGVLESEKAAQIDDNLKQIVYLIAEVNGNSRSDAEQFSVVLAEKLQNIELKEPNHEKGIDVKANNLTKKTSKQIKRLASSVIPQDFRCPISLELMMDPVIVSTGQTYERSYIQKWIDSGHRTCPKTQQKLKNMTLTPNFVLRSLIMQWCDDNKIEHPHLSSNGRIRRSDGTFQEINGDKDAIDALVHSLSNGSVDEKRAAAAEIRSLAKRSTDNRVLIADTGAIPVLVNLLSVDDMKTQEHAVTSLLNLSIYDNNKELIMMSGALCPIIEIIKAGSMEARENAAAAIFSLSLLDENKITIGGTPGAIESLVELLKNGSQRGKKDAATALFNLCIYQGNKARAIRVGILTPLLAMLNETPNNCMIDEALTILSVLVSHQEAKVAITKASMIPLLIDLLRTGQPRNKENAAAILLALCKKDNENLAYLCRLGAVIPLTELTKSGTDRAKRKATSLVEHLNSLQPI